MLSIRPCSRQRVSAGVFSSHPRNQRDCRRYRTLSEADCCKAVGMSRLQLTRAARALSSRYASRRPSPWTYRSCDDQATGWCRLLLFRAPAFIDDSGRAGIERQQALRQYVKYVVPSTANDLPDVHLQLPCSPLLLRWPCTVGTLTVCLISKWSMLCGQNIAWNVELCPRDGSR